MTDTRSNQKMTWERTSYLIKKDIERKIRCDGRDITKKLNFVRAIFTPSCMLVVIFRLQAFFSRRGNKIMEKFLALLNILLFSSEIQSLADIDEGFVVGHANGVLIHDLSTIGKNCTLMHQCTITLRTVETPNMEDRIVLGDNVLVGAGSRILGPCIIGDHSVIGMNSVVIHSTPPRSILFGNPASVKTIYSTNKFSTPELPDRKTPFSSRTNLKKTLLSIKKDLNRRATITGTPFNALWYLKMWFTPSVTPIILFRIAHWLYCKNRTFLPRLINIINIVSFQTEIGYKAKIGEGLVLLNGNGVIINHNVIIGKNVTLTNHNSIAIGPRSNMNPERDHVIIEDDVIMEPGAKIVGNLKIKRGTVLGPNSVTTATKCSTDNIPHKSSENSIRSRCNHKNRMRSYLLKRTHKGSEKTGLAETWRLIMADISRRAELDGKPMGLFYLLKLPLNPAGLCVALYRWQRWLDGAGAHFIAGIFYLINRTCFSVEISSDAKIGPGFVIVHANGIFIGCNTRIGENCILFHQNTIAAGCRKNGESPGIEIGSDVYLTAGAQAIGNIKIGERSRISSNSVVTRNCPAAVACIGMPARIMKKRKK